MVQALLDDLLGLAMKRPRFGYRRLHLMLRRLGWKVNHKRVYRIYRAEGLAVRRKRRKRLASTRVKLPVPTRPNERWSMDFVHDTLATGKKVPDPECRR
jgi:putative transposase